MYTMPTIYKQNFLALNQENTNEKIYTDASKGQKGVGVSVIWKNTLHKSKLPDPCSIFTAE